MDFPRGHNGHPTYNPFHGGTYLAARLPTSWKVAAAVWRAYVDESESNQKLDPGTYILAATLVEDDHADEVRRTMTALRPAGAGKLHWYNLSGRTRLAVVKAIASLPALHLVVVRNVQHVEPSERRRRKCLSRLTHELAARRVSHVVAEAREPKLNARELQYVKLLRAKGLVDRDLRLFHTRGPDEPILWTSDAVAGATAAARLGEPRYLELLAGHVDLVHEP